MGLGCRLLGPLGFELTHRKWAALLEFTAAWDGAGGWLCAAPCMWQAREEGQHSGAAGALVCQAMHGGLEG